MKLIVPIIHRNGDTARELLSQVLAAGHAIREAQKALQLACPNARNYYTIVPPTYPQAMREHEARLKKLQSVYQELVAIADGIHDQEDRRIG